MAGTQNDLTPTSSRGRGITPYTEPSGFVTPTEFFSASPWQMFRRMQEDMDRMMSRLVGSAQAGGETQGWTPSVDISEAIKHWQIEVDLPGVNKNDINVEVRDRQLIVRAELKQQEKEEQQPERRYYRRERHYGFFERTFPLPDNVDEEHITSSFNNGVLNIYVPKTEQAQSNGRRIEIGE